MIERFNGSVEPFARCNAADLALWISGISFEDWHQQARLSDGQIRPAMMTDLGWHGFGNRSQPIVAELMAHFPGCEAHQLMLSVVMPGHSIELHRDQQAPVWICRVHVPLTTNSRSMFIVDGMSRPMAVGTAYKVNTLAEHSVTNDGKCPRIHFMFDVRGK